MVLENIISFLIYCIIVTFTPGPTNIIILTGVYNFGVKKTIRFVYGAVAAIGLLLTLAAIFNSILIRVIPEFLMVLKVIGCIYMLYLAYQIYNAGKTDSHRQPATTFKSGFLMQLVNPKVLVFTMTVIPNFVMPYNASIVSLIASVVAVSAVAFSAMITWVLFGRLFQGFLIRYQKPVNLLMSIFLIYTAIMILKHS